MENFEELHISITFLLNCALAFPCLLVMSSSQSPVDVTTPPRYVNRSTPSIPCSLILTGVLILEFNHITLVKCLFKVNKALLPLLNPAGSSDSSFLHHLEFFESVFVKRLCLAQTERVTPLLLQLSHVILLHFFRIFTINRLFHLVGTFFAKRFSRHCTFVIRFAFNIFIVIPSIPPDFTFLSFSLP